MGAAVGLLCFGVFVENMVVDSISFGVYGLVLFHFGGGLVGLEHRWRLRVLTSRRSGAPGDGCEASSVEL